MEVNIYIAPEIILSGTIHKTEERYVALFEEWKNPEPTLSLSLCQSMANLSFQVNEPNILRDVPNSLISNKPYIQSISISYWPSSKSMDYLSLHLPCWRWRDRYILDMPHLYWICFQPINPQLLAAFSKLDSLFPNGLMSTRVSVSTFKLGSCYIVLYLAISFRWKARVLLQTLKAL